MRANPNCGRLHAHRQTLEHASPCSEAGACAPKRCSPSAASFPPQPPRKVSLRCSAGSQVLWRSQTSPARACPHYGLWPSRTGLPQQAKACWRSPGSRACCFLACAGSNDYAGPDNHSRVTRPPCCLPPTRQGVSILNCDFSKLNHPAHQCLRSTLQAPPRDGTRKTRGQDGFATSFPAGLLHPLQHAGLSRRSP